MNACICTQALLGIQDPTLHCVGYVTGDAMINCSLQGLGVIGIQWRVVACGGSPSTAHTESSPTQQAPTSQQQAFNPNMPTSISDAVQAASTKFQAAW